MKRIYFQKSGSDPVAIKDDAGNHVGNKTYSGWKPAGVETVSGVNQLIWKHSNGDFFHWTLNSSGQRTDFKPIKPDDIHSYEKSFDQDFNSDGIKGKAEVSYSTVESIGNLSLLIDSDENVY